MRQNSASPLLFVITVELLALLIRSDHDIKGLKVGDLECRVSQFADDTTCFAASTTSHQRILDIIDRFSKFSGLKLNLEKSAILSVGQLSNDLQSFVGIPVGQTVKILGIWYSRVTSEEDHFDWNFVPQLDKMKQTCSSWSNRSLSIKGRVTVFNALVSSLIQYVAMNSHPPPPPPPKCTGR